MAVIEARMWRSMETAEILRSIDVAFRVLAERGLDLADGFFLAHISEEASRLVKEILDKHLFGD